MKKTLTIVLVLAAVVLLGRWYFARQAEIKNVLTQNSQNTNTGNTNTTTPDETAGWKTSSSNGATFKYPENFNTKYITTVDWPPQVAVSDEPFTCTEAGLETAQAGITTKETINGHIYCVTKESEGAAGSMYTNYAYASEIQNKLVIFTFSLRFVQCDNYNDPQKTECKTERTPFNPDNVVDQIAVTLSF